MTLIGLFKADQYTGQLFMAHRGQWYVLKQSSTSIRVIRVVSLTQKSVYLNFVNTKLLVIPDQIWLRVMKQTWVNFIAYKANP